MSTQLQINITEKAADKVREFLAAEDDAELTALRVAVQGGGCSGFLYKFDLSNGPIQAAEDHVLEREGARVIVDKTSLQFIDGRLHFLSPRCRPYTETK